MYLPIISPTSAKVTSGVKVCPPLATATVCVTGPVVVDDEFEPVAAEASAEDVTEATDDSEFWAVTTAASTAKAMMLCMLVESIVQRWEE